MSSITLIQPADGANRERFNQIITETEKCLAEKVDKEEYDDHAAQTATHIADTEVHITDVERKLWNSKADNGHKHTALEITGGTFGGAVYAAGANQAPETSLLRNSKLVSAEADPTVNGEICWTYE